MSGADYLEAPAWTADQPRPRLIVRGDKQDVEYLPTWEWEGGGGPRGEEEAFGRLEGVDGMMYWQDGIKLYELAWFSPGDVLEIGTFKGRSAAIMASALRAAGNPARIVSLDIDPGCLDEARRNLARVGLADRVLLVEGRAAAVLPRLSGFRAGLVYIDGDHTHRGVRSDLEAVEPVVPAGAVIALHDYEGYEPDDPFWAKVKEAAAASWLARDCVFIGRFGLCGLFVRRTGGPHGALEGSVEPLMLQLQAPNARLRRGAEALRRRLETSARRRLERLRPPR